MEILSEAGIWARADAHVCALLMAPGRTERRLQAAERTIACAHRRAQQLRKQLQLSSAAAFARAARSVAAEFGQVAWGRMLRVRIRPRKPSARAPQAAAPQLARVNRPRRSRRVYKAPLIDARGRTAVYMRIRYVGLKSKKWSPGLAAKHIGYIYRDDALESTRIISNMGASVAEISDCWRALEQVETAYRANAIVQYRIVLNLPSELTADQRADLVQRFCERAFARNGLPYAAAVHLPDPGGDQRNFHAHLCFSNRPTYRTGPGEWLIEREKVNGLTDPEGLRQLRAQAAAQLNLACGRAGVARRYTHQTYAERGIDAQRQAHVGGAAMAAYNRGEVVARVETNAAIAKANELAFDVQNTRRQLALWQSLKALCEAQVYIAAVRRQVRAAAAKLEKNTAKVQTVRAAALSLPQSAQSAGDKSKLASKRATRLKAELQAATERKRSLAVVAAEARLARQRQQALEMEIEQRQTGLSGLATRAAKAPMDAEPDCEQRSADQAKAAEANQQLAAAEQRRRHIAEACRLLDELPERPYRVVGGRIILDTAQLTPQQRDVVERAGEGSPEVAIALAERATRDRQTDEQEQLASMGDALALAVETAARHSRVTTANVIPQSANARQRRTELPAVGQSPVAPDPRMSADADAVANLIKSVVRSKAVIFHYQGRLTLTKTDMAQLGVSADFLLLETVQAALCPIHQAQHRDSAHVLAQMAERPDWFWLEKDELHLHASAPQDLRGAYERSNTQQFRSWLAAYAREEQQFASLFEAPAQASNLREDAPDPASSSLIAAGTNRESMTSGRTGNPRPEETRTKEPHSNVERAPEPIDARAAAMRAALAGRIGPARAVSAHSGS